MRGVRRRPGRVELDADHLPAGRGATDLARAGVVGEVEGHQGLERDPGRHRGEDPVAVRERRPGGGHRRQEVRHRHRPREPRRARGHHVGQHRPVAEVRVPVVGPNQTDLVQASRLPAAGARLTHGALHRRDRAEDSISARCAVRASLIPRCAQVAAPSCSAPASARSSTCGGRPRMTRGTAGGAGIRRNGAGGAWDILCLRGSAIPRRPGGAHAESPDHPRLRHSGEHHGRQPQDDRHRRRRDAGMAGLAPLRRRPGRRRARPLPPRHPHRPRARERREPAVLGQHAVRQHHPRIARRVHPRRPGRRMADPLPDPVERARDGGAGEPALKRARRPHRKLRLRRDALRRGLQPLLARAERDPRRRSRVHAGPLGPGDLRPRLSRRPHHRGPSSTSSAGRSGTEGFRPTRIPG